MESYYMESSLYKEKNRTKKSQWLFEFLSCLWKKCPTREKSKFYPIL